MKNILVLTSLIFLISCGNSQQNSTSNTNNSDVENVYIYDQETNKKLKQAEDFINNDQYNKAFPILLELAKQGNPVVQNDVGASYQYGFNGETDEEKAIHWYTLAAKQNHAPSIHNLGLIAFNKAKKEDDYQKALTLFEKAAQLGSYEAVNYIGIYYENGIIFPQDSTKALENFLSSADHGSAASQFNVGQAYYYGRGVKQDYKQAFDWYTRSSNQNYSASAIKLAILYRKGKGTEKNIDKAIELLKPYAEQGYDLAQYNISLYYKDKNELGKSIYWLDQYKKNPTKSD